MASRLRYNGLKTTLGGSLTSSATSVTFAAALTHSNGTAVPTLSGGDYIPLAICDTSGNLIEVVYLTAYTAAATTGTISRGKEGTTGVSHASGDLVRHGLFVLDLTGSLDDSNIAPVAPNDQTGTSYTFALADKHRVVRASNAAAITLTIPPNSSVAYPLGAMLQWAQQGAGQVTVAGGAGVTIRTPHGAKTSAQYAMVSAVQVATDEWYVSGDSTT